MARSQVLAAGVPSGRLRAWVEAKLLHRVRRDIFVVGRPEMSREGWLTAAVLTAGPHAVISHTSAGWLWGIGEWSDLIDVSGERKVVRAGIRSHRRYVISSADETVHRGIPVTTPARTLADLSLRLPQSKLERAINDADRIDLIHPPRASDRARPDPWPRRPPPTAGPGRAD